nr:PAS domain-containing protein [Rhizobium sp. ACO-34A]
MPISLVPRMEAGSHHNTMSNSLLQRVRDFDWASCPAGPVEIWPEELRAVCRTALLSSTPMAVLIGRAGVVLPNDAIRILFGPDYAHGLGKPVAEVLIHSAPFAHDLLERAFRGHSSRFHDIPLPLSEAGKARQAWFDLEFTPIIDAKGDVHGALVVCIETTQRKKALMDLESSRERLDLALESGGVVGVWEIDFEHETVRSDARYALLHNVDPDVAAIGAHRDLFMAGIHPDDLAHVMQAFDKAKIEGIYRCQHRVVGKTGTRWIVASGRIKHDGKGKPLTFTGTAIDVTEQIETSAALTESEKRFRTYAETLPHVIFEWNNTGRATYVNRRWNEFTGCDENDPRVWDWQSFVHPDERALVLADWTRARATEDQLSFEARHLHASGQYRWMRAAALPIRDSNGVMRGWIGTLTDIHEEKLLQEERELVSRELDHRIKNFFAVTRGLVNLTARENHDDSSFVERIQGRLTALHHSHDLIRQDGGTGAQHGDTLHALIRHLLAPYTVEGSSEHIVVEGDDISLLAQEATPFALVFHELATNAAKYGALSAADGRLNVSSSYLDGTLTLLWRERGDMRSENLTHGGGFGSRLIHMIIERQMNGRFERSDTPEGVTILLEIPRP